MSDQSDIYKELFESSPDAILVIEDDRFVDCNPAAVEMLRFPTKQALLERYSGGQKEGTLRAHPGEFSPPTQPDGRNSFEKANEVMKAAFERGSQTFEWEHVRADGERFLVEVVLTPAVRDERRMLHVVWREIGERKKLEAKLRQTQRLESVGRLAGGIAHDFNNLLLVIQSHAELLQEELETANASDQAQHAAEIRAAADRAASLTHQLLTFSRGQPVQPKPVDLVALLNNLGGLLGRLIGEDIDFLLNLCDAPITVEADPSQIEQVVVNLAANARDAMPDGGRLEVALEHTHLGANAVPRLAEGDYAVIRVSDTGEGMTDDQIEHAFDPFFTTKPPGAGSGLGLATVHAVADQCGGRALIESTLGAGTIMRVYLPLTADAPVRRQIPKQGAPVLTGSETIIVAEDEGAIRSLIANMLEQAGYRVITASNGEAAVEVASTTDGPIDLILTDVVMPLLSGPETVRRLHEYRPDMKVIFMSGYSDEISLRAMATNTEARILEKPFTRRLMLSEIRRALDQ
jgi:signal transduction histidine kinase